MSASPLVMFLLGLLQALGLLLLTWLRGDVKDMGRELHGSVVSTTSRLTDLERRLRFVERRQNVEPDTLE